MASTTVTVRVEGLTRTVRALNRAGAGPEDMRDAYARIATAVEPDYARHTPVKTGKLKGNYRIGRPKGRSVLYVGSAAVPYAGPVNYGRDGKTGAQYVAKGDVTAGPKATGLLDDELSRIYTQLGLT